MHVKESHEDADHQAVGRVMWIAHGVPQGIRSPLDLHNAFAGTHLPLIENDPVRRREKVAQIRKCGADRITKKVELGDPADGFFAKRPNVCFEPVLNILGHARYSLL